MGIDFRLRVSRAFESLVLQTLFPRSCTFCRFGIWQVRPNDYATNSGTETSAVTTVSLTKLQIEVLPLKIVILF